jgi:nitric oxide reductase subunit B
MIVLTLAPVGVMQAVESFQNGFWSARSLEFYQQPAVKTLLWLRIVPDSVFIAIGVLPLVAAAVYGLFHLREVREPAPVRKTEQARELVEV